MAEAADGGQQMAYQAARYEEAYCRRLLEQLEEELKRSQPRQEEMRLLHARAEAGWLEAKRRMEKLSRSR
ncbi:hypothetical protein EV586_102469 [Tumebacillus sp. BK434]|uniref:hypothetical protein n=1 Tax=Tumebacillus sp. BK434 TaxID=2512169 RepID=UPI00104CC396|nr:hypothetical protein [Tumebacillus sp. BK434]TCP58021.1 hypothetical protein EV586_102469 [Tumebacillus sp. BK434]